MPDNNSLKTADRTMSSSVGYTHLVKILLTQKNVDHNMLAIDNDFAIISSLADNLQYIADLAGADVFIDMFSAELGMAVVVAEAKPRTAVSLYRNSVLGQSARMEDEPAVFRTFDTGKAVINVRGISQERVPIVQTVLPVNGMSGQVVAVLIMERDNSQQVQQEDSLKVLSETTQKLTDTLLNLSSMGDMLPTLLHDALLITNEQGEVSFANNVAKDLFEQLTGKKVESTTTSQMVSQLPKLASIFDKHTDADEIIVNGCNLLVRSLPIIGKLGVIGNVYLLRDITELRCKEKELITKSAVIKEIHHRVKNNLQTIASLMRLQMRQVNAPEAKQAFQESINRIKCIALVHEYFSRESPEIIEMKSCMAKIAEMVKESLVEPGGEIVIEVVGDKIQLTSELATTVSLVTNELLQNALEHGLAGRVAGNIQVQIKVTDHTGVISVADDGVGVRAGFDPETDANLGLQIAMTLVKGNLEGSLKIVPKSPGTLAIVEFPIEGGRNGEVPHHNS